MIITIWVSSLWQKFESLIVTVLTLVLALLQQRSLFLQVTAQWRHCIGHGVHATCGGLLMILIVVPIDVGCVNANRIRRHLAHVLALNLTFQAVSCMVGLRLSSSMCVVILVVFHRHFSSWDLSIVVRVHI